MHLYPRYKLTVFAFDFAGSGQSDGEYVTLGYHAPSAQFGTYIRPNPDSSRRQNLQSP